MGRLGRLACNWGRRPGGVSCRGVVLAAALVTTVACRPDAGFENLADARHLSADLLVHFTQASEATSRAVMADTDERAVQCAREAAAARLAADSDARTLARVLESLSYSEESRSLQEFDKRFAEYRALDDELLALAVENTNLKAQRISFGAAQEAADAFLTSIESVRSSHDGPDAWHVKGLVATAVAEVREIQVLQAPHIAEADDAVMNGLEGQMATSELAVRRALDDLAPIVRPASRQHLTSARAALDRFVGLNAEIAALSRRNTNVRALALSLDHKGQLTRACEESLQALRDALAKRRFTRVRSF